MIDHYLFIRFPYPTYSHLPTSGTCTAVLEPDGIFLAAPKVITGSGCQISVFRVVGATSYTEFQILVGELVGGNEYPYQVTLTGITNPSTAGGTGYFKLETRQGTMNVFDYNHYFATVGIIDAPPAMAGTVTVTAGNQINALATYEFAFTTTITLPAGGSIKVQLPTDLSLGSGYTCTVSGITGLTTTTIDGYTFKISGFTSDVSPQSWTIVVTNVQMPSYSYTTTNKVIIQTWMGAIYSILQEGQFAIPAFVAGSIPSGSNLVTTHFGSLTYPLTHQDTPQYEVFFKTANPLPNDGAVVVTFPAILSVSSGYCRVYAGLEDISSSNQVSCAISGNVVTITKFRAVAAGTLIILHVRAYHTTASTGYLQINTYLDSAATKLVDTLAASAHTYTIDGTYTTLPTLTYNPPSQQPSQSSAWVINWQPTTTIDNTNTASFTLTFDSGFSFSASPPTCELQPSAGVYASVACSVSGTTLTFTTSTQTFANSATHNLRITNVVNPSVAGTYYVEITIVPTTGQRHHQTSYITVTPATIPTATFVPFTIDQNVKTMLAFTMTTPIALSPGNWQKYAATSTSRIRFELSTQSATLQNLFATDLGTGLTTGSSLPCYAILNIAPSNGQTLTCIITVPAAAGVSNPVVIEVKDYTSIPVNTPIEIHIPNVKYSESTTTAPSVTIYIQSINRRLVTNIYSRTITLSAAVVNAVTNNPKNSDGTGATTTNIAPIFNPKKINFASWTQFKYTPANNRNIAAGQGLILIWPTLPTTSPQSYILPRSGLSCYLGYITAQVCYSYPEVGWVIFKNLASAIAGSPTVTTIILKGFTNPFYAGAPSGTMKLITVNNNKQWESAIYTTMGQYSYGAIKNVSIYGNEYRASYVNVNYTWIFVTSNPVPKGGSIKLIFPPNYYDLTSDPAPYGKVVSGLSDQDASNPITFSFAINVAQITKIAPIAAGTLIYVVIYGVRNPPSAGVTVNFEIQTLSAEGYVIDRNNTIPGATILTAQATGSAVFNYFYTSPNNGLVRGNYKLSYYPQTTYPKNTQISIAFPTIEFDSTTSFPSVVPSFCTVSGALSTLKSCTLNTGTKSYTAITDTSLEIQEGMPPLIFTFPHIMNYNPNLDSGVVTVSAIYDSVTLDASPTGETNRKATFGNTAGSITLDSFYFSPTNEAVDATYVFKITPSLDFYSTSTIQVEFPYEFPRGLGTTVACSIPSLQISATVPVQCTIEDWIVNITNHIGSTANTQITITISGVINPNREPALSDGIAIWIFQDDNSIIQYVTGIGSSTTYTASPGVVFMTGYSCSSPYTRTRADYAFELTLLSTVTGPGMLGIKFGDDYILDAFSPSPSVTIGGSSAVTAETLANNIPVSFTGTYTAGSTLDITVSTLYAPLDAGIAMYPSLAFIVGSAFLSKTYSNLNQPLPLVYSNNGQLIVLNNNADLHLIAGSSAQLTFVFPAPVTQSYTIIPVPTVSDVFNVDSVVITTGSRTVDIWIGVAEGTPTQTAYIEWTLTGDTTNTYWVIRPLAVHIKSGYVPVTISPIGTIYGGGRSVPIYVTLGQSPTVDVVIQIIQLGSYPTEINIFPTNITFKSGQTVGKFWVSAGKSAEGDQGQILYLVNGTNKGVFKISNPTDTFYVIKTLSIYPVILKSELLGVASHNFTVRFIMSERTTFLFMCLPSGSPAPAYEDAKAKQISYDYFGGEYVVGEWVDEVSNYDYTFTIGGLRDQMQYDAYIWAENFYGNTADEVVNYTFTTLADWPVKVSIGLTASSVTTADVTALQEAIQKVIGVSTSRMEYDLNTFEKSAGSSAINTTWEMNSSNSSYDPNAYNSSQYNRIMPVTNVTQSSLPAPSTGSQVILAIFPPLDELNEPASSDIATLLNANIGALDAASKIYFLS